VTPALNDSLPKPTRKSKREKFRPATPIPKFVHFAFWIMIALEVLHAVNVGSYLITNDFATFADEFNRGWTKSGWPEAPVLLVAINFLLMRAFLVGLVGFFVWVAILVRRGVKWARVVTTISGAVGLLTLFGGDLITLFDVAASIVAVVLLWLPSSRAFFDAVKVERGVFGARQLS
jgi:hypothetical protein